MPPAVDVVDVRLAAAAADLRGLRRAVMAWTLGARVIV
jgi:hypothetical protein